MEEPIREEEVGTEQEETAAEDAPGESGTGDEEEQPAVQPKVASADEKLAELQDRYLRLTAEYDNFRKRTLKEKIELQRSANEKLLVDLLSVADDFDRARKSMEEATDVEALKEGMKLIAGKFDSFLSRNGVSEIEAVQKDFDTDLHEAITKIPAPQKKLKGKVVDVVQKGYYLHEKVLRYAKVVIGE
ncbi:MAG: nucleotide exchange factor GrpE [Bacteroidales bacterium]